MPNTTAKTPVFESLLTQAWRSRGFVACLLLPLAVIFFLIIFFRRLFYRLGIFASSTLPVPVIVVGNIFIGGTGKTPLVIWLVSVLRAHGYSPGVISRGYGAQASAVIEVKAGMSAAQTGDEPLLITRKCEVPVFVGRDRVAAARGLLAVYPKVDVIISDDGLQHYALDRTMEIQLSDTRGHGNGWLLPAGPLREPASRRSDFYVINGGVSAATAHTYNMQITGTQAVQMVDRQQGLALASLQNKRVAAVAGIGHPERFFEMLRSQGVVLESALGLPDHFDFSTNPFAGVKADIILITEKDAVKCSRIAGIAQDARLWIVPVEAKIAEPLAQDILEKLRG
ncbi:LpxK Tetraacyldisaccharide-1-P 4'-kinase [Oxalobacteraceae bacterium]